MKLIHLALQSEYSFRQCYAPVEKLVDFAVDGIVGIADINNTFGHVRFEKACKQAEIKPVFGVRLYVVPDLQQKRIPANPWIFIAANNDGLKELYQLVDKAWKQFYYFPKLSADDMRDIGKNIWIIASEYPKKGLADYETEGPQYNFPKGRLFKPIAVQAQNYMYEADKSIYEILAGRRGDSYNFNSATYPQHIVTEGFSDVSIENANNIAYHCNAQLPKADKLKFSNPNPISELILYGAKKRNIDLKNNPYAKRIMVEWELVKEKGFEDYFKIVADMVQYAKRNMLVGPARGSSAGSLICYLLEITEIDPIKHNLIFERFIDANRADPPDIDIDFPDNKRSQVIVYLKKKYGEDKVQNLCTVNTIQRKSALNEVGKVVGIDSTVLHKFKESNDSIRDITKTRQDLYIALDLEGHAQHAGKHAAGVLISNEPLIKYGSINSRDEIIQIDKYDASYLNLLKIDCLGLKTLSIIEECLDRIHKPYSFMYDLPLDDATTFKTFRDHKLNGIFQFEGYSLRTVTREIDVKCFEDLVLITALARPGSMNSGGTAEYIQCRKGNIRHRPYYNGAHKRITKSTLGVTVFQEQMMQIAKEIGLLSWEDVSKLRKAVNAKDSKVFQDLEDKFLIGATDTIGANNAAKCWEDLASCGNYLFNRSHSVSYSLISYWTAYLKTHYPLQYACAYLNHTKDHAVAIKFLREMVDEYNIKYTAVDVDNSEKNWSINDGILLGGLTNIDGIGDIKAMQVIKARTGETYLTPGLLRKLVKGVTDFDTLFPIRKKFKDFIEDSSNHLSTIDEIYGRYSYKFIGHIIDIRLKSKEGQPYINFVMEDDYDQILCRISPAEYEQFGAPLVKAGVEELKDKHFLVSGKIIYESRYIFANTITCWSEEHKMFCPFEGDKK